MKAILREAGGVRLARVPIPERGPGEVLVRVAFAGVCRTDVYVADGRLAVDGPRVLGHELSGVVWEGERAGMRVTAIPLVPCARCTFSDPPSCAEPQMLGLHRDGAFAEYVALPARAVLEVPDAMPLRRAAYVEPVAAALAVLKTPIKPDERGLVMGENRIAELTRRVLRAHGFGVATDGEGPFDFVVETGEPLGALLARVKPGGRVILKSRPFEPVPLDLARAVAKEITLHGASYGSFRAAIALLERLCVDDLFEDAAPLEDFARVLARARANEARKLFFAPGDA
jgi:threonine dehydrogenase-like Zn-dependent dehydrogenase